MKPPLAVVLMAALVGLYCVSEAPAAIADSPWSAATCAGMAGNIARLQQQIGPGKHPTDDIVSLLHQEQAQYELNCGGAHHFVVYPRYAIVSLFYAPPGCSGSGCSSNGTVTYENNTSSGTKLQTDKAFKNDANVTVDYTLGDTDALSASAGVSGGIATTTTDSFSETITNDQTSGKILTSTADGVDHDNDLFYLLLNSAVMVQRQGKKTFWNLGYRGHLGAIVFPITVAKLKTCDFGQQNDLFHGRGLTRADCDTILAQDPFANGSTAIDPHRYVQASQPWPYQFDQNDCPTQTFETKHERDTDSSHQVEKEYTTGYSLGGTAGGVDMKFAQNFTWTNSSTTEATTGSTQSANVNMPCPSVDYEGQNVIVAYWDTLYGSFMFMPMVASQLGMPVLSGHLTGASGQPMRHEVVELSYGGRTYRTATNKTGDYAFFGASHASGVPAVARLSVRGVARTVQLRSTKPLLLRIP